MDSFIFSYPAKVYFGEGSAAQAFNTELGKVGETVMLAYGGGSVKKDGIYDEMKEKLSQAGKKVVDFSGIMSNPTYAKVQEGAALVREQRVDFILAVGGGSDIDETMPTFLDSCDGLAVYGERRISVTSELDGWLSELGLTGNAAESGGETQVGVLKPEAAVNEEDKEIL